MSLTLALSLASQLAGTALPPGFAETDYQTWRQTRQDNLRKPDGWLSLVGLVWLDSGKFTVGSAPDNHYQLARGPEHLGTLEVKDNTVRFVPAAGAQATLDGVAVSGEVELHSDATESPGKLAFGDTHFIVIDRSGKLGLRVKSTAAPVLTAFKGIDSFPFDANWVVTADWLPFDQPQSMEVATMIGTVEPTPTLGKVQFTVAGKTYTLQPTSEGDELFFVFGDRTNGRDTYGMSRFLYASLDADGKHVVLDFNRAYNPPCAFTPYATCPLPSEGNRLDLAVTAGEKKYGDAAH